MEIEIEMRKDVESIKKDIIEIKLLLEMILSKLVLLEKSSSKLDEHIDFVEETYDKLKKPLNFIKDTVNNISMPFLLSEVEQNE
jgi:hypothetical protein